MLAPPRSLTQAIASADFGHKPKQLDNNTRGRRFSSASSRRMADATVLLFSVAGNLARLRQALQTNRTAPHDGRETCAWWLLIGLCQAA